MTTLHLGLWGTAEYEEKDVKEKIFNYVLLLKAGRGKKTTIIYNVVRRKKWTAHNALQIQSGAIYQKKCELKYKSRETFCV